MRAGLILPESPRACRRRSMEESSGQGCGAAPPALALQVLHALPPWQDLPFYHNAYHGPGQK